MQDKNVLQSNDITCTCANTCRVQSGENDWGEYIPLWEVLDYKGIINDQSYSRLFNFVSVQRFILS